MRITKNWLAMWALAFLFLTMATSPAIARHELTVAGAQGDQGAAAQCPAGQVLMGFTGRAGVWIDRIGLICGQLQSNGGVSQGVASGPTYGGAGGSAQDVYCRDSTFSSASLNLTTNDRQVASIAFTCRSPVTGEETPVVFGNAQYHANCGGGLGVGDCPVNSDRFQDCPARETAIGFNVRYGQHVNGFGLICGLGVAAAAPTPAPPVKRIKISGKPVGPAVPVVPGAAFTGLWKMTTSLNGHFDMTLVVTLETPGESEVHGSFVNTDGAHQYDGTLSGIILRGAQQLIYTYSQPGANTGGQGDFNFSADGKSISGAGFDAASKVAFTWTGTRE